jgi:CheY-like chemotaxis protein
MSVCPENGRLMHILLVEDNPADARLTAEALRESKIPSSLDLIDDGDEAMAFLRREGKYRDAPRPDLVLLDLNLPKKDGMEMLAEIKGRRELRQIPVVILTTSSDTQDIRRAYELHANCYVVKPYDVAQHFMWVEVIQNFWFNVASLPSPGCGREQLTARGRSRSA